MRHCSAGPAMWPDQLGRRNGTQLLATAAALSAVPRRGSGMTDENRKRNILSQVHKADRETQLEPSEAATELDKVEGFASAARELLEQDGWLPRSR